MGVVGCCSIRCCSAIISVVVLIVAVVAVAVIGISGECAVAAACDGNAFIHNTGAVATYGKVVDI